MTILETIKSLIHWFNSLSKPIRMLFAIVMMFALSQFFPWRLLGDFGSYGQAGLILGAIFLIVKWLNLDTSKLGFKTVPTSKPEEKPSENKPTTQKKVKLKKETIVREYEEDESEGSQKNN